MIHHNARDSSWKGLIRSDRLDRTSQASDHLDLLRGIAALAVLLGHLHSCFFGSYRHSGSRNPVAAGIVFLSSFSHEAVIIFFVMSGFLIGASVLNAIVSRRWSWSDYLTKRATRLYVVLLPALIVTVILDHLGLHLFGAVGNIYEGNKPGFNWAFTQPDSTRLGAGVFLGNALYLQGIVVSPYGSNMALWSLSYEWWYYILFPVALIAKTWALFVVGLSAGVVTYLGGTAIVGYFGIWLMGAALNSPLLASIRWLTTRKALVLFAANLILIRICKHVIYHDSVHGFTQGWLDYELGTVTLLLIEAILRETRPRKEGVYHFLAGHLSGMSYSLYAVHSPIVVFCTAMLVGRGDPWKPGLLAFSKLAIVASITLIVAYVFARSFEDRTDSIRRIVTVLISRSKGEKHR